MESRCNFGAIQGGPLSPLLANIYLHEFDKSMVSQGFCLVRYADDFLILCKSEGRAHHALEAARRRLSELRLTLNPEKTRIVNFNDEIKFLGHVFDSEGAYEQNQEPLRSVLKDAVRSTTESVMLSVKEATSKSRFVLDKGKKMGGIVAAKFTPIFI